MTMRIRAGLRFGFILPSMCIPISLPIRRMGFRATTGEEFLDFLRGVAQPDKAKVMEYIGAHPKALAFVQVGGSFSDQLCAGELLCA